jgi:phage terminase small subunit
MGARLTAKQQRFVDEFLVDQNCTQAATRAGYRPDFGRKLARKRHVKAAIEAALAQRSAETAQRATRAALEAERVLAEYELLAHSDIGDILDFTGDKVQLRPARDIPERARRAIRSMKVRRYVEGRGDDAREVEVTEFALWSKPEALARAAQHLGLLKERHEHSGPDGGPIPITFVEVPAGAPAAAAPG